jgi:hypothetical protein
MDSLPLEYIMTIHRVTGKPLRLKLRRTAEDVRNAGSAIENGMAGNYLGVVLGGKLTIIPAHQIVEIQIDPAPKTMIGHVIKHAELA